MGPSAVQDDGVYHPEPRNGVRVMTPSWEGGSVCAQVTTPSGVRRGYSGSPSNRIDEFPGAPTLIVFKLD
jgi:hypothetical protein